LYADAVVTVRLSEGLVLAVLLPLCFARIRRSDAATCLLAAAYGVYIILPVYQRWQSWLAVVMSALCATLVRRRVVVPAAREPQPDVEPPSRGERLAAAARGAVRSPVPLLAVPAAFGVLTLGGTDLWHTIWRQLCNDRLAVTVNGTLAAVFAGGLVTGLILRRFSSVTAGRAQAVLGAGNLLGWLERLLYFSFLLAGQPTAAAFALTAKSAARFPALQRDEEGLAEYYLIGSLSSLVIAVATALLTRLALGMAAV
jgi:hypothetical protein